MTPLIPELYCSNLQLSLVFYVKVLGFMIAYQREDERFAMLTRQGASIMLDEVPKKHNSDSRTWLAGPLATPFGRGINLQIQTTAVDKLYLSVLNAKANIFLPIEEKWYPANEIEIGHRQFIVQDPDGYLLRFVENLR